MFGSNASEGWRTRLRNLFSRTSEDALPSEELRALLYEADLSGTVVDRLMNQAEGLRKKDRETVLRALAAEVGAIGSSIGSPERPLPVPGCILLLGVNGSGKTTTAAKLAARLQAEGKKIVLAAADTFRAGAIEQLKLWGDRLNVEVVAQNPGADPGAVVFDAWQRAVATNAVLIADTAGRLQNKLPLIEELKKVIRILGKDGRGAPHECYLVIDGTTGQNAIAQAREFLKAAPVSGLVVTKLDGSSRGGGALSGALELNVPIRFVGVGEKLEQLTPFDSQSFGRDLIGI